jgi:ATP-binding cassette subfamily F protein 2
MSKKAAKGKAKAAPTKPAASVASVTEELSKVALSNRSCTGVLSSHHASRDLQITNFNLALLGQELVVDSELDLSYGNRYGLLGLNGCGKTTLLKAIAHREVPIPSHMDCFMVEGEVPPTDRTALQTVIDVVDGEVKRLEAEADRILAEEGPESEVLQLTYEALDKLEPQTAEKRAGEILHGLGFDKAMQAKKTRDFSGGWRMRIALACALFVRPYILLLDEPTNHLDLGAVVWLEEYLRQFDRILVVVSHSQDFLNGVCTNILQLTQQRLKYFGGNYDTAMRTRQEQEENQAKMYQREQEEIAHMKEYIARFGHGSAKLARQAQSKEKTMARMIEKGLTEKVYVEKVNQFYFDECGKLPPPILQMDRVTFGYTKEPKDILYKNVDFAVDLDSRIALVGPNGAGKSTFLKLLVGANIPLDGSVRRHHHLRIAWFHQHLTETLDLTQSPLEFMMKSFPGTLEIEIMRKYLGRYGLSGKVQTTPMETLSDGQRSRVVFAFLAFRQPHLLCFDEPTNHLDLETIDALAKAINEFDGGLVLVSHDFRLLAQVAKEIWICEHKKITRWNGTIQEYKAKLRHDMGLD